MSGHSAPVPSTVTSTFYFIGPKLHKVLLLLLLDLVKDLEQDNWKGPGEMGTTLEGSIEKLDKPATALSVIVIILTQSHVGSVESSGAFQEIEPIWWILVSNFDEQLGVV